MLLLLVDHEPTHWHHLDLVKVLHPRPSAALQQPGIQPEVVSGVGEKLRQPLSFLGLPVYFKLMILFYTFTKASVVSNSVQSYGRQPTRLLRPWDSLGKNTGVGCHFLLQCMKVKSQSEV